jgi:hypothetical protein
MLLLRLVFTVVTMAICIWLLATGRPLGGLLFVPIIAIWAWNYAESRGWLQFASRRS